MMYPPTYDLLRHGNLQYLVFMDSPNYDSPRKLSARWGGCRRLSEVFSDEQTVLFEKAGGGHFHVKVLGEYQKQLGGWLLADLVPGSARKNWGFLG